ncbi:helix-turn-helix domain-containing protein [Flavobacterium sp. 17A]|uniref:Helix-turn-helix domain-containing protein n=1 Tax=Flavobacterium potami TaxID=2872310 RepID=A0A9X1HER7_9FLAO|nr:helix-turn-helix domain-containing protein [Flavobacterium potami]MBZ4037303.1 helix-turn-helix domain-containing protein [Flavobacterium potami]
MNTTLENIFEKIDFIIDSITKIESKLKTEQIIKPPPKKLSLDQAVLFLQEKGIKISKSSIYKLTSNNSISFRRFGNRLVFSEDELEKWISLQLKEQNVHKLESVSKISNSAQNKIHKNNGRNRFK